MKPIIALILAAPDSAEAAAFRTAAAADAELRERFELRFSKHQTAHEAIADAEIIACGYVTDDLLAAAPHLRWLAFWSAGLDGKMTPELLSRRLLVTNGSGVHGPNIAEHVLGWMLMFTRELHLYVRYQQTKDWNRTGNQHRMGANELAGQTLGIVGLGHIGESLCARAKAFEMRVVATKRDPAAPCEAAVTPDVIYPSKELPHLLAESDHVCIALPYTPETHHLFDAAMLAHLKPTAYLYNIGRGKIVDEPALITALQAGKIAGAGLDVFETEPLPAESPLWEMENVLITPHVAGITPHYFSRFAALFAANLKRYLHAETLHNLYDAEKGY